MKKYIFAFLFCLVAMSGIQTVFAANNEVRLIRSATLKIEYGNKTILLDPMLGEKGTLMSALGVNMNPRVHLTMPIGEILDGVDLVLLTHTHVDHYDRVAKNTISKDIPFYVQPADLDSVSVKDGFVKTQAIADSTNIDGMTIIRIDGSHGRG